MIVNQCNWGMGNQGRIFTSGAHLRSSLKKGSVQEKLASQSFGFGRTVIRKVNAGIRCRTLSEVHDRARHTPTGWGGGEPHQGQAMFV
jgi:hypothetical protein